MNTTLKTILFGAACGASLALVSCVVPAEATVSTTTTERTYEPGYTVSTLPSGYRSEVIGGTDYYYNNGAYYQRRSDQYVVVEAPRKSRYYDEYTRYGNSTYHNHADGSSHKINELPSGYTTVNYQGEPYYRYQDRFYRRQGSGYVVVASPF